MKAKFCGCYRRQEQERKRCKEHPAEGQVVLQFALLPSILLRMRRRCCVGRCVGRFLWRHTVIHWNFGIWVNMAASHHLIIYSVECGVWVGGHHGRGRGGLWHVASWAFSLFLIKRGWGIPGSSHLMMLVRGERVLPARASCTGTCSTGTAIVNLHVESRSSWLEDMIPVSDICR